MGIAPGARSAVIDDSFRIWLASTNAMRSRCDDCLDFVTRTAAVSSCVSAITSWFHVCSGGSPAWASEPRIGVCLVRHLQPTELIGALASDRFGQSKVLKYGRNQEHV